MLTHRVHKKHIARFTKESIVNAQNSTVVVPDAVSQLEYRCRKDSSFDVLSDEATVVGVQLSNDKAVAKEHITIKSRPVVTYSAGRSKVYTLAVDQHANLLLAGESKDRVVQYRLDTGDVTHDYGSLGIGAVLSSARLGKLYFFGGWKSSSFAVIDTLTQQVVQSPVTTAVHAINSLAVWTANPNTLDAKAILAVAGRSIDYSADRTDMFDVTQLVYQHGSQEIPAEFTVLMRQRKQQLAPEMRTLEQQFYELQSKYQVQTGINASLESTQRELLARVNSLEQKLQKQANANEATIQAKDQALRRLESDNQALRESARSLKKSRVLIKRQLRSQLVRIEGLVSQKVVLGLFQNSLLGSDANAVQLPDAGVDIADDESLQVRFAAVQRRNAALTELNQELQIQNFDLRAEVQNLSPLSDQW